MPKILGVDDSATMRRILEMTFAGDPGSSIATVEHGETAIRWAGENGVDIVLADASMPGTDGYEVARHLRGNPATQGIAVIVLASQHHPFDAEKARACGVDDHVLKPFETAALIEKVREVLGRARPASSGRPVAAAPPSPLQPPRPPAPAPAAAPQRPPAAPVAPAQAPRPAPVQPAPAQPARATVAFGAPPGTRPPQAPAQPISAPLVPAARPAAAAAPAAKRAEDDTSRTRSAPAAAAAATTAPNGEMAGKLSSMGLTPEQIEGVLALSREVIERVVWEVVPDLAETIIREEIKRLTSE